jgi:hypothetical protein
MSLIHRFSTALKYEAFCHHVLPLIPSCIARGDDGKASMARAHFQFDSRETVTVRLPEDEIPRIKECITRLESCSVARIQNVWVILLPFATRDSAHFYKLRRIMPLTERGVALYEMKDPDLSGLSKASVKSVLKSTSPTLAARSKWFLALKAERIEDLAPVLAKYSLASLYRVQQEEAGVDDAEETETEVEEKNRNKVAGRKRGRSVSDEPLSAPSSPDPLSAIRENIRRYKREITSDVREEATAEVMAVLSKHGVQPAAGPEETLLVRLDEAFRRKRARTLKRLEEFATRMEPFLRGISLEELLCL